MEIARVVKRILVERVDYGVCEHILDSLDVHNHQVSSGDLPGEMRQSLGDLSLVAVGVILPTVVVALLDVLALDVLFSVEILQSWVRLVRGSKLVDVRSDEVPQDIWVGDFVDDPFVEESYDLAANRHQSQFFAHGLNIIVLFFDFLHDFANHMDANCVVVSLKSVSEVALTEGVLRQLQ